MAVAFKAQLHSMEKDGVNLTMCVVCSSQEGGARLSYLWNLQISPARDHMLLWSIDA